MPTVLDYRSALCLKTFSFIEEEEFCDVEIRAKERTFTCHKVVLAAASPLLREIVRKESTRGIITSGKLKLNMKYLSSSVVESLLRYIYCGDSSRDAKRNPEFNLIVELLFNPQKSSLSLEDVERHVKESLVPNKCQEKVEIFAACSLEKGKQLCLQKIEGNSRKCTSTSKACGDAVDKKGPFYIVQIDKSGQLSFLSPQKPRLRLPRKPPFLCPCQNCGKIFETFERLRSHYRHNHGEKKFKCSQCPLRFLYPKDLKSHMRTHTGEKPFICERCGKGFAQISSLGIHLKVHEKADKANIVVYPCPDCKKRYCLKEKPSRSLNVNDCDLSSLRCPNNFCAKKFSSAKTLRKHILNDVCNPGKSYCAECCTTFDSMLLLKQHVGKMHCTHKRKQRRVRVDPSGTEPEDPARTGSAHASGAVSSGVEFGCPILDIAEQSGELGFEQVDNILELRGEVVEMDAEETNIIVD